MAPRVMLAGGGTGGHLYPAIAIADAVRTIDAGAAVLFIGTKGKIEERVVPERGYDLATIWISGVKRSFSLATALVPVKILTSLVQSFLAHPPLPAGCRCGHRRLRERATGLRGIAARDPDGAAGAEQLSGCDHAAARRTREAGACDVRTDEAVPPASGQHPDEREPGA